MGSLDLRPRGEVEFERIQTKLTRYMVVLAVATTIAAGVTAFISYQTGLILDDLEKSNQRILDLTEVVQKREITIDPILIEDDVYEYEEFPVKLVISSISPYHSWFMLKSAKMSEVGVSISCINMPELILNKPITRVISAGGTNVEIDIPFILNYQPSEISKPSKGPSRIEVGFASMIFDIQIDTITPDGTITENMVKEVQLTLKRENISC